MSEKPSPTPESPTRGIETIEQLGPITVDQERFPWLQQESMDVPTVLAKAEDGTEFRYGSLVNARNSVAKLADNVDPVRSQRAEDAMFKAIGPLVNQGRSPGVEHVAKEYIDAPVPIYKTKKSGPDVARLFFAVLNDEEGKTVVLKLGVAKHKKQEELRGIFNNSSKNRRKKDG